MHPLVLTLNFTLLAWLEHLLRCCARSLFPMGRLKQRGADLVYRCGKGHTEPLQSDKYSGELVFMPPELINRIAQLVPPPRTHRRRDYGVQVPHSPLRAAVTAMVQGASVLTSVVTSEVGSLVTVDALMDASSSGGVPGVGVAPQPEPPAKPRPRPKPKPKPHPPSHCLWAALIARIYEVFPLLCPTCCGQMRTISFITFSADIHKILEHIGGDAEAPRITPARGPPRWDGCGAQKSQGEWEGAEALPDWDRANQSPPNCPDDQRTTW